MSTLMVSISGIRGIVGESLTPQIIQKYVLAFGSYMNRADVIVGGDSRTSGQYVKNLVKGCLQATGCHVIDIGIVPTPTVQLEILHHHSGGGIAITASHNPAQWNGLKFMDSNGRFLSPVEAERVFKLADQMKYDLADWQASGSETMDEGANQRHIDKILALPFINIDDLKNRKLKVAVDCVNGAGGMIIPQLLQQLGCKVIDINREPNGHFAHTPEPLPENLEQLKKLVKESKADIGFAVDPDVDRCAIVDNSGSAVGEENTLVCAVKFLLSKKLGSVVVNMSTSRASEDIARYYNCPFYRSKVGEINVVEEMIKNDAVIGGEGNGGVILPELHMGRDAPIAIAITLQHLLETGGTSKQMIDSLPKYQMVKSKVEIGDRNPDELIEKMINTHSDMDINLLDGLKIDQDDHWVHLRKSNTEPIIRIIAEAPTHKKANQIVVDYTKKILSF